ncbi:MAG: hypothetical protein SFU87_19015 [Chitinophagaceae bacterium]|nr:hypothetical protein [Chitinophagaceae bacterium]
MSQNRQHTLSVCKLASIMFTGIVPYSALMNGMIKKVFEILNRNPQIRKAIIEEANQELLKK